jgi:hypothetical protein
MIQLRMDGRKDMGDDGRALSKLGRSTAEISGSINIISHFQFMSIFFSSTTKKFSCKGRAEIG